MRTLYTLLVSFLGVALALPVSGADDSCHHLTLDPLPTWTYSGTWDSDGRLLLVDIGKKTVWAYDPFTGRGDAVWATGGELDQPGGPALIQRHGDAVLVEVHDALYALPADGSHGTPITRLADASGLAGLRSVHSWAVGDDRVLLYGDHYHPVAGWRPVLAVSSLGASKPLRIVETLSFDGPDRMYYTNSQNFLAILGDTGYVLTLMPRPRLLEIDLETGDRRTLQLPAALSPRVDLPPASGLDTTVLQQAALASTHRPAAVYAYDGLLYILSRHPQSASPWRLTAFDPETAHALSATALPSQADHVVLVPGKQWALIEKGPFEGYGQQKIHGVSVIPASQITGGGHACTRARVALQ